MIVAASPRHSTEALERKRAANEQRFLRDARDRFGDRFDYSRVQYVRQKLPVVIVCPVHGEFGQTPDKHLRSTHGCPMCSKTAGGKRKSNSAAKAFLAAFADRHGGRLELLGEYRGAKTPLPVRCRAEGHVFEATPDNLIHEHEQGCQVCSAAARHLARRLTQQEFLDRARSKFPDLDFSATVYSHMYEPVRFVCPHHGEQERRAVDLLTSSYGCSRCGDEQTGYAGHRIARLKSGAPGVKPRPTRIALMRISVGGLTAFKLGITARPLEARYREALQEVLFEVVLDELDALLLEQLLHRKYSALRDRRIKYLGMREGKRWAGDEEVYVKAAVAPMLDDLQQHVAALKLRDPGYWDRYPELGSPQSEPRPTTFSKGVFNGPRPVIRLTDDVVFPSATAAAEAIGSTQALVSMVCSGKRGSTKGHRFAYLDEYDGGSAPQFTPRLQKRRSVVCLDTQQIFPSVSEAARQHGCSAGGIVAVCRGRRPTAGGARWAYLEAG
jgi:hypothetical protein